MAHKGKLKYSADLNFWYVLEENGNFHELSDNEIIDADLYLSDHYYPCAINITTETVSFSNIDFRLDRCFDYDIIFYQPRPDDNNFFEVEVPF